MTCKFVMIKHFAPNYIRRIFQATVHFGCMIQAKLYDVFDLCECLVAGVKRV